jgi:poly(3-hydroxybutyrate) depolymerase
MAQHIIDPRRVYVAGLSAGGAMADIVGNAYPEVFAAVGVHSGLARGAAGSIVDAFAAMRSGAAGGMVRNGRARRAPGLPTIVFHGDEDRTVHPNNGEEVIAAALRAEGDAAAPRSPVVEHGQAPSGRNYTRSTHHSAGGDTLAEHWLVHGAGHAWSGGDSGGSYTDGDGPDATGEMLRFFFEHPQPPRN